MGLLSGEFCTPCRAGWLWGLWAAFVGFRSRSGWPVPRGTRMAAGALEEQVHSPRVGTVPAGPGRT